ncbi:MAG: DNA-protecting protein DprA [Actinobacteria bacterium]|nr:DNA-protecting protein DprA [Actinomycetota bacterium]
MSERRACVECLRRSWLLALLGSFLERTATGKVGRRSPELLRLSDEDLVEAVAPEPGKKMLEDLAALEEGWFAERLEEAGCWSICRHDDRFPPGLRDAADGPRVLLGLGDFGLLEAIEPQAAVTIVGSRRATSYGREVARDLARELSDAGLVVVSGLAFGIDACAHRGALDAKGRTIAVLGCGPDTPYPAAHRGLWRAIVETGAVISELPPGSTPWRWSFPARNRVMAALAGMTVVVEAAARSGSLITADLATELGRDLGAVPGPVTSRPSVGPNELLAGGACVVRGAQDVLDAMLGAGACSVERTGPPLEQDLAEVLSAVEAGATNADAVAIAVGLSAAAASVTLARLELLGYLTTTPTGTFARTLLSAPTRPSPQTDDSVGSPDG